MSVPISVTTVPGGDDTPIGVPESKLAKLPTSFRINAEIKAHLSLQQEQPRSRGFHPSGIAKMCAVKFWLYDQAIENFASPDPEVIKDSFAIIRAVLDTPHEVSPGRLPAYLKADFHGGDSIHEWQQFHYGQLGYLWGKWECVHCRAKSAPGFMPRMITTDIDGKALLVAAPCTVCRGQNFLGRYKQLRWRYLEPWVGSARWKITGHTDGIFLKRRGKFIVPAIFEIKSINEAGYHNRYGDPIPKPEHIKQASLYAEIIKKTYPWLSNLNHIYFCYVNKNAQRETKEFLVEVDSSVVADSKRKMTTVLEAGQVPTHARLCQSIDTKQARECPLVERCYGCKPSASIFDKGFSFEELPL